MPGKTTYEDPHSKEPATAPQPISLMSLVKQSLDRHENALGFCLADYLELVDWAGRAVREDKQGAIVGDAPPILRRIGLDSERYLQHLRGLAATEKPTMLGRMERIRQAADALGRSFIKGVGEARRLFHPLQAR